MRQNSRIDDVLVEEIERLSDINEVLINRIHQLKEENGKLNRKIEQYSSANGSGNRKSEGDAQDYVSAIRRIIQEGYKEREQAERDRIIFVVRGEREEFPSDFLRSIFGAPIDQND